MQYFKRFAYIRIALAICVLSISALGVVKPAFAQNFTVTGTIQYQNPAGVYVNVQIAKIEILVNGAVTTSATDTNGNFSVFVSSGTANPSIQLKVYAQDNNAAQSVQVKDSNATTLYAAAFPAQNWNLTTPLVMGVKKIDSTNFPATNLPLAFHIYDQIAVVSRTKLASGPTWTPTFKVDVAFPASTTGSNYDTSNKKINIILSDRSLPSVIIHEYGHVVMHMLFVTWPLAINCPSPHSFTDPGNGKCAWTEGWANFFQAYIRNTGNYDFGGGNTYNLESPTRFGPAFEVSIAGALWDVYDGVDTAEWDNISSGIGTSTSGIWGRMQQSTITNQPFDGPDFLTRWLQNYNVSNDDLRSIFAWNGMCTRKVTNTGTNTTYQHSCSYTPYVVRQY